MDNSIEERKLFLAILNEQKDIISRMHHIKLKQAELDTNETISKICQTTLCELNLLFCINKLTLKKYYNLQQDKNIPNNKE